MKFAAEIRIRGINPYVLVSAARARRLGEGWKKPMPVVVRLNGKPETGWRINMMPAGDGSFYLYLDAQIRKAAAAQVGDKVAVSVTFDAAYRTGPLHEMLPVLAARLEDNPVASARWEALSPSLRKEILRYLAGLKSEDAKLRNIERALRVLGGATERFLARDWN